YAIPLECVPAREATGFVVSLRHSGAPAFKGRWSANYVCGRCGAVLCDGIRPGLFVGIIFQCLCGQYGRVPVPPG
ncbi:MAG TPA: hypothetical protein VMK12_33010, partial [Anaeromyxobacteraceae bacterium]|nr:hypothetical protein [Anaeromyxobacteraceae bacterium]